MSTLIDSAAKSPVVNSNQIPDSFRNNENSKIQLISAFGEKITADIITLPIALKSRESNCLCNSVNVLFVARDKLYGSCIITPTIYELLQSAQSGGKANRLCDVSALTDEMQSEREEKITSKAT